MASRLIHRVAFFSVLGALASLGACDCGEPPGPEGVARIVARFPNGPAVQSDGESVLQISLTATAADQAPDTAPISVTAGSGGLAARGASDFDSTFTGNPTAEGVLDLDFRCDFRSVETVPLEISNGTVSTTVSVRCIEPRGDTVIIVDDSDCTGFAADGESTCRVGLTVEQRATISLPLPGALEVVVLSATPLNSGDTAATQVVSSDGASSPSDRITVTIGDDGTGEYFLHAPTVAETVEVELTSSGVTVVRQHEIELFVNEASIDFPNGDMDIAGGATGEILIRVNNPAGQAADTFLNPRDVVDIRIEGGDGVELPDLSAGSLGPAPTLEDVTITNGAITLSVRTTAVTEAQVYTVTVTYQPLQSLDPIERQVGVTVNPPGTLLLEVSATKTTIQSDSLTPSDLLANVNVRLTVDGAAATGGSVLLTIPSDSTARIAFTGSDGVAETPEDDARSYMVTTAVLGTTGAATVPIQVTPNVPSGIARIVALGRDSSNNTVQREIVINVERAPILQAIVFEDASPPVIGVQGGSMASSTAVSFFLFDDAGRAMPNVGVTFSSNATADRGITVTANAVSDGAGRVVTVLSAGTVPGPVTVLVSAESGLIGSDGAPILRTSQSNPIPIVGGLPSFETSSFECGPFGAAALYSPYIVGCDATLADKFSNVVPDLLVQFSAEAATEAAAISASDGVASVDIASNEELRPLSDLLGWSYGVAVPNFASELVGTNFTLADAQACFDDLISTPCDILKLCNDPAANAIAYCPLPENGGQCLDHSQPTNELSPGIRAANALLNDATLTPLAAATTRAADIASYVEDFRACGYPVACYRGRTEGLFRFDGLGIDIVDGDYCPVNRGCMDFTTATECPQDAVRTMMASVRGAEAFSDFNGNGIFDYDDVNNNGVHDRGEAVLGDAFVDMPEPYLDRNDNCFRDDASDNTRFVHRPIEKVRNTDQFYDVNGDTEFGFNGEEMSGAWDFDTQIFFVEKLLEISGVSLEIGELCPVAGAMHTCAAGGSVRCIETARGEKFARGCGLPRLGTVTGTVGSHTIAYRWTDGSGNCPSVGFADTSAISVAGFVNTTGRSNLLLDQEACGYYELMNPLLPHCTSVPMSSAPLQTVTLLENCARANDPVTTVTVGFTLDGGAGRPFTEFEAQSTTLTCL